MIVVLSIEYDGTNYSGWQKQTNANTVQQEIENAIFHIYGEKINTIEQIFVDLLSSLYELNLIKDKSIVEKYNLISIVTGIVVATYLETIGINNVQNR